MCLGELDVAAVRQEGQERLASEGQQGAQQEGGEGAHHSEDRGG